MAGNSQQKLKLLYIRDILERRTDDEHPLSADELCTELMNLGISAERKSVYRDIEALKEFGCDINVTRTPKAGFYIAQRKFELPEVRLLLDAVQSAGFITPKKTKILISKLNELASESQADALNRQVYVDSRIKPQNEEIYYNIDCISSAISDGCKITFRYIRHRIDPDTKTRLEAKTFVISPYALLWSNDHYYLIGNNEKYDNLMHLRVDKMTSVSRLDKMPVRPFSEVCEYKNHFDTADYANKTFNMFGGTPTLVELRCDNSRLEEIIDRFGPEVSIRMSGPEHFVFRIHAMLSEGLISWIISFGLIEVISPISLRKTVASRVEELGKLYKVL